MKTIHKKQKNKKTLAELIKDPNLQKVSEEIGLKLRLAVEIYEMRVKKNYNQQELAASAGTTQKIVSKIENGDVNVGIGLLHRLARELDFSLENFAKIFPHTSQVNQNEIEIEMTTEGAVDAPIAKVGYPESQNYVCQAISPK